MTKCWKLTCNCSMVGMWCLYIFCLIFLSVQIRNKSMKSPYKCSTQPDIPYLRNIDSPQCQNSKWFVVLTLLSSPCLWDRGVIVVVIRFYSSFSVVLLQPWCSSVCMSGMGVHCDHTVHVSTDLSFGWIVQCSGYPDTKACPLTPSRLFPVQPGTEVGHGCAN